MRNLLTNSSDFRRFEYRFQTINGGRPRTNEYLFDGISVLQPEPGQVAFFPNVDAIQEFKIESNSPPAEFGRFNGGVINLTTKAGSNSPLGAGRPRQARGLVGALVNDWTLAGVVTLQSGMPIAVTQTTNNNAFAGFGTQRPNLIGDPTLSADARSVNRWFNTSAFATAPQFTIGTSSRNPVRGPGYRRLDMALIRRVPLPSGKGLEIRAEVFNATNTPPLGAPNGVFGSAAFGTITAAGDPRVVQLAIKLTF